LDSRAGLELTSIPRHIAVQHDRSDERGACRPDDRAEEQCHGRTEDDRWKKAEPDACRGC
jgi:hypothetical protein